MNRNRNPYVCIVALVLLALILMLTCTGCKVEAEAAEAESSERFTVEEAGNGCSVITDNATGTQYLYYFKYYTSYLGGSGLCKLDAATTTAAGGDRK